MNTHVERFGYLGHNYMPPQNTTSGDMGSNSTNDANNTFGRGGNEDSSLILNCIVIFALVILAMVAYNISRKLSAKEQTVASDGDTVTEEEDGTKDVEVGTAIPSDISISTTDQSIHENNLE